MLFHTKVLNLFFENINIESIGENTQEFEVKGTGANPLLVKYQNVRQGLEDFQFSDNLIITITSNEDPFSSELKSEDDSFWNKWTDCVNDYQNDESIEFELRIQKQVENGLFQIYSLVDFEKNILSSSFSDFIDTINKVYKKSPNPIVFLSNEIIKPYYTSTAIFTNTRERKNETAEYQDARIKIHDKINSVCHFSGLKESFILPSDLFLIERGSASQPFIDKINKACLILSLASIFDVISLNGDDIFLKINGYKSISDRINVNRLDTESLSEYYKIYQWITSNGSIHDKIGLARNLISLNVIKDSGFRIDNFVFTSIVAGYKVYEKQNVKQYIELRNKISDQIIGFNEKASKIVEGFASNFQKSALVFVSLFSTIVVSRVLSTKNFKDIFTLDATIIALAFLIVSFIYFLVSRWEVKQQISRFVKTYENMKRRNEDLLSVDDINKILNNDTEYNEDKLFMEKKVRYYCGLWIGFVFVFLTTVLILHFMYRLNESSSTHLSRISDNVIRKTLDFHIRKTISSEDSIFFKQNLTNKSLPFSNH